MKQNAEPQSNLNHQHRESFDMFAKSTRRVMCLAASMTLLAGCAIGVDPSLTGSVPGSYEQRHPVVLAEQPTTLDIALGMEKTSLTTGAKSSIMGFVDDYKASGATRIQIMVPSGAANESAAAHMARKLFGLLVSYGVTANHIVPVAYDVDNSDEIGNIRLAFSSIKAHVPSECGLWPKNLKEGNRNQQYHNFGCATQKNFAAQLADPSDLINPRRLAPVSPGRRDNVVDSYRTNGSPAVSSPGTFTPGS